jgi:hypothetical protein
MVTSQMASQMSLLFTSASEQQTYEEEKHENRQAPKCFNKPIFSPARPAVAIIGVFHLINEQKLYIELCGKHVTPHQGNGGTRR